MGIKKSKSLVMRKGGIRTETRADQVFDVVNIIIMLALLVIFAWPLWFVLIASFSNPVAVNAGEVLFLPKEVTLDGYKMMFEYTALWKGYANTIFYTVVGTLLNMVLSVCMAYPLADKEFGPRKILIAFFMFTMYFSGGLIPSYLLLKRLGILNTRWAMIIPGAISVYNCLILRNYFMNSIPGELKEAAILDGANKAAYLWRIVLPLSKAVLAVVGLYYMVSHWNGYTKALYYIYDKDLYPLQSILRDLLISDQMMADVLADPEAAMEAFNRAQTMKYCVVIAAVAPMLCTYPFVQKYFVKGVMVGSVKG